MDCAEDEYYFHGECHRCQQCPPGQELKEECGYGVGVSAVCVQCEQRWFKGEWGSHSCRMCQTCRHLNRQEITPCTRTHNAACGDCLPGFYSKRRLDGLQDLECLPCGPAPFRNAQCRSEWDQVENIWSSEAPPHNAAVMTTACVAAVTMVTVLFVIVVLMYKGFSSLRSMFKGCLSPPGLGHRDLAASSVSAATEHRVTQSADVEASEPCESSTCPGLVSMAITPSPCPHHCTASESLPLQRSSICSDTSGVVSQATGSPDIPSGQSWSVSSYDLTSRGQHCAVEQESAWGHHAPVECSELDFINISLPLDLQASAHTQNRLLSTTHSIQRGETETGGGGGGGGRGGGEKRGEGNGASVGERRSSCGDAAARSVTLMSDSQLMERGCASLQGMHLGSLPLWLVRSLALKLDPVFPGVNNYQKVALQLGISSDILSELHGFEHLFLFLSSTTLLTVPDLLRALGKVQRVDALLLISEYATNVNMANGFSHNSRIRTH